MKDYNRLNLKWLALVFSQLLKVEVALSEVGVARPEGPCHLGGSAGMLPQEILKF